jgi:hypothetical protein
LPQLLAPFDEPLIRVYDQAEGAAYKRQCGISGFGKIVTPVKRVDFGTKVPGLF